MTINRLSFYRVRMLVFNDLRARFSTEMVSLTINRRVGVDTKEFLFDEIANKVQVLLFDRDILMESIQYINVKPIELHVV